jgi:hypothetical protein
LRSGTTYSYCLVATNPFSDAFGGALAFRIPALAPSEPEAPVASGSPLETPDTSTASPAPGASGAPGTKGRLGKRLRACRHKAGKRRAKCRKRARTSYRRERNQLKAKAD